MDGGKVEHVLDDAEVVKEAITVEERTDIINERGLDSGLLWTVTTKGGGGGARWVGRTEGAGEILFGEQLEVR